jgi:ATP-dependent Clp protease adaptor protein ClpS
MAKKNQTNKTYTLTVFNNEHTSFTNIISVFKSIGLPSLQAEQCAQIIHLKGKYNIINGHYDELRSIQAMMHESNIQSEIISDEANKQKKPKT